jgi:hypothetical protein
MVKLGKTFTCGKTWIIDIAVAILFYISIFNSTREGWTVLIAGLKRKAKNLIGKK